MSGLSFTGTSAEGRLLGALCRPRDVSPSTGENVSELVARIDNWPRFLELLQHHRVIPIAARNSALMDAEQLPPDTRSALQKQSAMNALAAFSYISVLVQLLGLLAGSGAGAMVLKGIPLSLMAYGDVAARDVGDIDLLIEPGDALSVDQVLRQAGYVRQEPAAHLSPRRAAFYLRNFKDFTYQAGGNGFEIDLHWRLLRDSRTASLLLPPAAPAQALATQIGTVTVQTMTVERTLLYLAVHGAMEGWARWKTLADVAALWQKASPAQRSVIWQLAHESATTGFLAASLELTNDWFGTPYGEEAVAVMASQGAAARRLSGYIVRRAHQSMLRYNYTPPPVPASSFAMKFAEARLYRSAASRLELARRILFRPRMWETLDLPDHLFALYPLLSPFEWLSFRGRSAAGRGRTS